MRNPAAAVALQLLGSARGTAGNVNVQAALHDNRFPDMPQAIVNEAVAALLQLGHVTAVINGQGVPVTIQVTPHGQGTLAALVAELNAIGNASPVLP